MAPLSDALGPCAPLLLALRRRQMTEDLGAAPCAAIDQAIIDPLILDFLEWLETRPRPYSEVMEAWRTSCPRLTVWEDAADAGYVERRRAPGQAPMVALTPSGLARLRACRPAAVAA
jgi:hypothetical protein